tara:strand:+ start:19124 stop:19387 length:264 start_codon:yes stop_codon:yes gene_type:complete
LLQSSCIELKSSGALRESSSNEIDCCNSRGSVVEDSFLVFDLKASRTKDIDPDPNEILRDHFPDNHTGAGTVIYDVIMIESPIVTRG